MTDKRKVDDADVVERVTTLPSADKLDRLEAMLRKQGEIAFAEVGHDMGPNEVPLETLSADVISLLRAALTAAVAAEQEACAVVAEDQTRAIARGDTFVMGGAVAVGRSIAAAIRARSTP